MATTPTAAPIKQLTVLCHIKLDSLSIIQVVAVEREGQLYLFNVPVFSGLQNRINESNVIKRFSQHAENST